MSDPDEPLDTRKSLCSVLAVNAPISSNPFSARREAQPLLWKQLSEDQRRAIVHVARILSDLAKAPHSRSHGEGGNHKHLDLFLPAIDPERRNHIILLDGDRGSGKTALLVTLLHAWNHMLRGKARELDSDLHTALAETAKVVPIGLIDLQPLPKSTNLLLYLVGRFQRVVEAIEQVYMDRGGHAKNPPRRDPWHGAGPEEPECTKRWRDFVQAAAMGWNGDLERRRGNLDPEAFVLELEQTERRRLDVVSSFRALMDALVDDYRHLNAQPPEDPLFLLAIDDADTNPDRAGELLDLVRTLWHPRVAFLLTGHTDLFLATLRHRLKDSLKEDEFKKELAIDIYNKAIPPAHRCWFPRLSPDTRLVRMRDHLQRLKAPAGALAQHFDTLLEVFESNAQIQEALPSRERSLADLKVRVEKELADMVEHKRRHKDTPDDEAARYVIATLCRSALSPSRQAQGEKIHDYGPDEDLLDVARIVRNWEWRASDQQVLVFPNHAGQQVIVQRHPRWETTHGTGVTPELMATGMLARDVVQHSLRHRETIPPLKPMGLLGTPVRSEYALEMPFRFAWPLPDWPSFAHYLYFGQRWKGQVPDPEKHDPQTGVDLLASRFLETVVLALCGDKREPSPNGAWETLAEEVYGLTNSKDPVISHWAVARAGLMAAPESGLTPDVANQWLESLINKFGDAWPGARTKLQKERQERLRVAWRPGSVPTEETLKGLISDIDKNSTYKWHELIERKRLAKAPQKVNHVPLLKTLEEIPTPWCTDRPNLASYFDLHKRKRAFNAGTSSDHLNKLLATIEPYKGRPEGAAEAAVKLWLTACSLSNAWIEDIEAKEGRVISPFLDANPPVLERAGTPVWQAEYPVQTPFSHVKWEMAPSTEEKLPNLINVLLRALFDMKVDAVHDVNSALPSCGPRFWPGCSWDASVTFMGYMWPVPGWPTCYDWERLSDAWNVAVERAPALGGDRADIKRHQAVIDGFAYWLLLSVCAVFRNEPLGVPLDIDISATHFADAIMSIQELRPASPKTSREKAFATWCDELFLLCAPESGLSMDIAETVLKDARFNVFLEKGKETLESARTARSLASGVGASSIATRLSMIDRNNRKHPWVKRIVRGSTT